MKDRRLRQLVDCVARARLIAALWLCDRFAGPMPETEADRIREREEAAKIVPLPRRDPIAELLIKELQTSPEGYRQEAGRLRREAEAPANAPIREQILRIASQFDQLGETPT